MDGYLLCVFLSFNWQKKAYNKRIATLLSVVFYIERLPPERSSYSTLVALEIDRFIRVLLLFYSSASLLRKCQ